MNIMRVKKLKLDLEYAVIRLIDNFRIFYIKLQSDLLYYYNNVIGNSARLTKNN